MKKLIIVILIGILIIFLKTKETGYYLKTQPVYESKRNIQVYFCSRDQCEKRMLEFLKDANSSVHCAFFDLNLPNIKEQLKESPEMKLVIDIQNIEDAKELNPVSNFGYQLMHNKFCIVDRKKVLTGSFNPTERDNFYNNNNILIIESKTLAENYEDEFDELYNSIFSGGEKVKYTNIFMGNTEVENYFCPEDDCSEKVLLALKKAQRNIYFMTFSFTDDKIGELLTEKWTNGVEIKGVFEKTQLNNYSEYQKLLEKGVDIKVDSNSYNMHHKVFIIDNNTVITGSYNPTESGDKRNDENILIIHDIEISKRFLEEFENVWNDKKESLQNCEKINGLLISEVYYDTTGKDEEEEYVSIYNPKNVSEDLDYYLISNGKNSQRLSGFIGPNETKKIMPKFSLPNKNGQLILLEGPHQVDYVNWEGLWKLEAKRGYIISRKEFTMANCEKEWEVKKAK